jgi:prolyl oligopeptidase
MSANGASVYLHTLGEKPVKDMLVFHRDGPTAEVWVEMSQDGRFLLIRAGDGSQHLHADILVKDLLRPFSHLVFLVKGMDAPTWVKNDGTTFYLLTEYQADRGRIVKATLGQPAQRWKTIVPQGREVIHWFSIVGHQLFLDQEMDGRSGVMIYSLGGRKVGALDLPSEGSGFVYEGNPKDQEVFYLFSSYTQPETIYRYDIHKRASEVFASPHIPFDSSQYETRQVFYHAKDGTLIPMYISGKKGLARNGEARVLLTAYGGFGVTITPGWKNEWAWWMQQGGFLAYADIRGGGEYGESWHRAGMLDKKQNSFDDFYAAAEYLIQYQYTSRDHLAIEGSSNGGLLMGAAMTQRPDLFAAIVCGNPVLDMLRFHKFLLFGPTWVTEYGSPDSASDFRYLLKYSPYHNVKPRSDYPAILFVSGDSDSTVDPMHARKMTARMQAASTSGRPILLFYSKERGHAGGLSIATSVQDEAEELAFLWNETGPE